MTLEDQKDELQNKIREVFRLSRILRVNSPSGSYVHHDAKSGVLLSVEGGNADLAKDISMQIVAMRPKVLHVAELDPAEVDRERAVLKEAALREGKPANIVDKMVEGRLRNFYAEHVLTEQPFVKDDKNTVGQVAKNGGMTIRQFVFWRLGEK
jgi:elongation factor Ts